VNFCFFAGQVAGWADRTRSLISISAGVERLTGLITTLRSTRIMMRSMNGSLTLGRGHDGVPARFLA
jgi:hypothetical protein